MTYFFDVMSTLIYDPFLIDVPKELNQNLQTFLSDKDRYAWIDFEMGDIDEQEFARRFSKDGKQAYIMRDIIWSNYRWIDGMKELLISLRKEGHTICTLSNYPTWYHELDRRVSLSSYVDHHFVSYRLRARKPNPKAYTIPMSKVQCTPEQAIFIDDRKENCDAAQQLGIRGIVFQNAAQLIEVL